MDQRVVLGCSLVLTLVISAMILASTFGSRWYSCTTDDVTGEHRPVDAVISLWRYCEKVENKDGSFKCENLKDVSTFDSVMQDFVIMRSLNVVDAVLSILLVIVTIVCIITKIRVIARYCVVIQAILSFLIVGFGVCTICYATARAEDIVGENVSYSFGWSCVIGWMATILALLNGIVNMVLLHVMIHVLLFRARTESLERRSELALARRQQSLDSPNLVFDSVSGNTSNEPMDGAVQSGSTIRHDSTVKAGSSTSPLQTAYANNSYLDDQNKYMNGRTSTSSIFVLPVDTEFDSHLNSDSYISQHKKPENAFSDHVVTIESANQAVASKAAIASTNGLSASTCNSYYCDFDTEKTGPSKISQTSRSSTTPFRANHTNDDASETKTKRSSSSTSSKHGGKESTNKTRRHSWNSE